ncbi:DUF2911 domain-containing protein [Seonamhaeicola sp. ML3]|uniref:DUF2911 domain-containing protein n=1 Tax=Seonamhaeicola sp. ML3 TaxID=2937786 RepID=UPI0020103129|nr:DUF2911 domain-containing protein [Seonamhaeicola sp. ML3]
MRKLVLLFMAFATISIVNAQVKTPAPSPSATLKQTVGLTDITIAYSRPGVKGRKIFGGLEPWGTVWRTGANKNTTITFSDDIMFDGQEVKAGTYAIYTRLNSAEAWDVMLYADSDNWGTPQDWDDSKVVATSKVKVYEVPFNVETLAIDINQIKNSSAVLEIIWEKSYAAVPFTVPTDAKVSKSIKSVMNGPSPQDYFNSAVYYYEEGKDISEAVKWIDKAVEMTSKKPRFWFIHQQALIHAKAGNKKAAIEAAKTSLELAKKRNYQPFIDKNEKVLKEWGAM